MKFWRYIVVHYDEIGIKKKNRPFFEKMLINQLKLKLNNIKVEKRYGRLICKINNPETFDYNKSIDLLKLTPGVANFSFSLKSKLNLLDLKEKVLKILEYKKKDFQTFRVSAQRSNKNFKYNSQEVNNKIGAYILDKYPSKKVDLDNAELDLAIEIVEKDIFIYCNKYYGIGGLAINSSGRLVSSLSGGIDSPVASYMMMKRGSKNIFVHIQNNTITDNKLEQKIKDLVKRLTKIQGKAKLYIIPFSIIQKKIISLVPSKYRMIIYRVFMIKILNNICNKENAQGIVTGDSLAQVASQTLENLNCIYYFAKFPIISPLIGLNKNQIIKISKKIRTYKISIKPYPDCCSFMIAKHPQTKAKLKDIKQILEKILSKEKLIKESINNSKIFNYNIEDL